jgi:hypothetical protein
LQKQTKNIKSTQQDNQNDDEDHEDRLLDRESMLKMDREQSRGSELQKKSEEFLKTRAELLKSRRAVNVMTGAEASQVISFPFTLTVAIHVSCLVSRRNRISRTCHTTRTTQNEVSLKVNFIFVRL